MDRPRRRPATHPPSWTRRTFPQEERNPHKKLLCSSQKGRRTRAFCHRHDLRIHPDCERDVGGRASAIQNHLARAGANRADDEIRSSPWPRLHLREAPRRHQVCVGIGVKRSMPSDKTRIKSRALPVRVACSAQRHLRSGNHRTSVHLANSLAHSANTVAGFIH